MELSPSWMGKDWDNQHEELTMVEGFSTPFEEVHAS